MIDATELIAAVLTAAATLLPILFKQYRSAIAKAMRIGARIVDIMETFSEMENEQIDMLDDVKGLMDKVRKGETPTVDEITHISEHVTRKMELFERLRVDIQALKDELAGG